VRDVLKTTVYVSSSSRDDLVLAWNEVADAFGDHDPPSTLVGVTVLGYRTNLSERFPASEYDGSASLPVARIDQAIRCRHVTACGVAWRRGQPRPRSRARHGAVGWQRGADEFVSRRPSAQTSM
jgi:hypothetical protein